MVYFCDEFTKSIGKEFHPLEEFTYYKDEGLATVISTEEMFQQMNGFVSILKKFSNLKKMEFNTKFRIGNFSNYLVENNLEFRNLVTLRLTDIFYSLGTPTLDTISFSNILEKIPNLKEFYSRSSINFLSLPLVNDHPLETLQLRCCSEIRVCLSNIIKFCGVLKKLKYLELREYDVHLSIFNKICNECSEICTDCFISKCKELRRLDIIFDIIHDFVLNFKIIPVILNYFPNVENISHRSRAGRVSYSKEIKNFDNAKMLKSLKFNTGLFGTFNELDNDEKVSMCLSFFWILNNTLLQELRFSEIEFEFSKFEGIRKNHRLRKLYIEKSKNLTSRIFVLIFEKFENLAELGIICWINKESLAPYFGVKGKELSGLKKNKNLVKLCLPYHYIGNEEFVVFLKKFPNLEILNVSVNRINEKIVDLLKEIPENFTLLYLNLKNDQNYLISESNNFSAVIKNSILEKFKRLIVFSPVYNNDLDFLGLDSYFGVREYSP